MSILTNISSPADIKSLDFNELSSLAKEIRTLIIEVMQTNGGHLASNLGSVELILALHYVFQTPLDKLIFDTSHQTYTHKIITGRKEEFSTIRQFKGLSGFASPAESLYDHFYAGHAGTGLSLALGLAKSRDLFGSGEYIVPVISDAPFACGLTFEALNHIPHDLKKFILILNDNAMAISNGVGTVHHDIFGKNGTKPFFEQFHLNYLGPVDGHDIGALIQILEEAKRSERPVVIHALTVKGQGLSVAEEDPIAYHGVKPVGPALPSKPTFPKIFGKYLLSMADKDSSIVAITPAMTSGSCLDPFMKKYPDRCIDVGIAEGHAVTFAGGLAYSGQQKVVCCIYATFFQRALDNLFQDVVLQNIPVLFALDRGGLSPSDGTTHHGIYDIGFLVGMPNMVIAQPRDGDLMKDLLSSAFHWNLPTAIRYPNMQTEETNKDICIRELGKGEILAYGKEVAIIALGHMCHLAIQVRQILQEHGIEATIVDPIFVKPLDTDLLLDLFEDHHHIVTIEEHSVINGLGMVINSYIAQNSFLDITVQNFGLPDQFIEHGSYNDLMNEAELTPDKIAGQIQITLSLKQPLLHNL